MYVERKAGRPVGRNGRLLVGPHPKLRVRTSPSIRKARGMRATPGVRRDLLLVLAFGAVALVAHGINMFDYPASSLADDEGTYIAQAWAILREARLSPYTYTYDHAPGGWLLIAAWFGLIGPRAFGSLTATARELMLVLHVSTTILLFVAARQLGIRRDAASVGTVALMASPLALFYGREAILDNIMSFWLVVALVLLAAARDGRLTLLAGFAFGVAILSKEPAAVLLPCYGLLAAIRARRGERRRRFIAFVVPAVALVCTYPAYALAQGQFWPTPIGSALTTTDPRAYAGASLMDSVRWQLGRPGGNLLESTSAVHAAVSDWIHRDAALLLVGLAGAVASMLRWRTDKLRAAIGSVAIVSVGFLVRGGFVLPFHVPLALPFLALNFGLGAVDLVRDLTPSYAAKRPALVSIGALALCWSLSGFSHLYEDRPGLASSAAIAWIQASIPRNAVIVGRDDMWAELHEPDGQANFADFYTYWGLAYDRDARAAALTDDWRSIDYIVVTADLLDGIRRVTHDSELIIALRNASLVAEWVAPSGDPGLHPPQIVEIWEVKKTGMSARTLVDCDTMHVLLCVMNSQRGVESSSEASPSSSSSAGLRPVTRTEARFD
jgi:4-amino-4-deoxy-L-arabinose transferase-like glycosyltransferase